MDRFIRYNHRERSGRKTTTIMESSSWRRSLTVLLLLVVVVLTAMNAVDAFTNAIRTTQTATATRHIASPIFESPQRNGVAAPLLYQSTDSLDIADDDSTINDEPTTATRREKSNPLKSNRWASLNPKVKERVVKEAQERAIANKQKREPSQAKKRRMMMFVKEKQRERKNASRVQRLLSFDDRTPLTALIPGMEMTGQVISLTNFGAYIDVGTQCDGLLHISQISRDFFVEHPRQVLTPGDEVTVQIRSVNANRNKLHLTMLPRDVWMAEKAQQKQAKEQQQSRHNDSSSSSSDDDDDSDRLPLDEIQIDDELWGELRRVTDYGAYVEVGAVVDGWLHFMDHPEAACHVGGGGGRGLQQRQQQQEHHQHPSDFMSVGDRVRVWVSDVNHEQQRIKLTALRPNHLPGPRREF